ncbi:gamma-glutamyl hydrolase A-like [Bolinopsis microptera]|uniref:gamma-glutamyl hydrolase A-like n=1 Tax=Bolinopsis microptera TaxID=2820187 RepID=UPI0030795042
MMTRYLLFKIAVLLVLGAVLLVLGMVVGMNYAPVTANKAVSYPPTYKGPVIGILTQKTNGQFQRYGHSYIAASYVQWRAVKFYIQKIKFTSYTFSSEFRHHIIMFQTFPISKFYEASKYIYDWTVNFNKNGSYFPLWGTCLGFEAILYAEANTNVTSDIRFKCSAHMPNNLTIQEGAQNSRMLSNLDSKLYQAVQTEQLVYNSHSFCIGAEQIESPDGPLHNNFNLLAVNWDANGKQYIALAEHKKLPIYASQFHTEKSAFEWTTYKSTIPHTKNAILFMQYLANFFVGEARQSKNQFSESVEFYKRSINNYKPVYTAIALNYFLESCYFFHDRRDDLLLDTTD